MPQPIPAAPPVPTPLADPAWGPPERAVAALVVIAALVQVGAYAWAVPGNDYVRDLIAAAGIADGREFPALGPLVNNMLRLGPAWYWLLALPFALGAGPTAVTVFVGALATLKAALAWRLGRALGGRRVALVFAALLLAPGWGTMHLLQLTHTAVLETMLLACALPLLRLWRGEAAWHWALFGGLWGLATQAHPVALLLALPATAVAWRRRARWHGDLAPLLAGAALAILPSLPMLWVEWRAGFPSMRSVGAYAGGARPPLTPLALLALLRGWTVGGVHVVQGLAPVAAAPWLAALAALPPLAALAGLPAVWRQPSLRGRWLAALAATALAALWLLALRANVPFYLAALCSPALALGLAWPLAHGVAARPRTLLAATAAATLAIAGHVALAARAQAGHGDFPLAAFQDVAAIDAPTTPLALMPMWAHDRVAAAACGATPLHVHGELAALVDFFQGLPFARACAPAPAVVLMGRGEPGARHWAGATPATLRALGWDDAGWAQAIGFAPARVLAPDAGVAIVRSGAYPHRSIVAAADGARTLAFALPADQAVAAYAPLFVFDGGRVLSARVDGVAVAPVATTNAGALFLPPADARGTLQWTLTVSARVPDQVDVVALPLRPR